MKGIIRHVGGIRWHHGVPDLGNSSQTAVILWQRHVKAEYWDVKSVDLNVLACMYKLVVWKRI